MRLESLFGIDVYRKRRMDASDRLVTVKEEYEQLRNVMAELQARREEIGPEVRRASELREILDKIEEERKLLYWLRRNRSELLIVELDESLEEYKKEQSVVLGWSELWKKALTKLENDLVLLSREKQQQTWELEQSKKSCDGLIKSGYASASNLKASKERLDQAAEERRKQKSTWKFSWKSRKRLRKRIKKHGKNLKRDKRHLKNREKMAGIQPPAQRRKRAEGSLEQ